MEITKEYMKIIKEYKDKIKKEIEKNDLEIKDCLEQLAFIEISGYIINKRILKAQLQVIEECKKKFEELKKEKKEIKNDRT